MSTHTASPVAVLTSPKALFVVVRSVRFTTAVSRPRMMLNITGAALLWVAFSLLVGLWMLTGHWTTVQWAQAATCLAAQPYFIARVRTARRTLRATS